MSSLPRRLPAPAGRLHTLLQRFSWLWRLMRYGVTSIVALGVSEATLLIIIATHLTGATVAAAIATFSGMLPSYLLSRYWIWPEADRQRTGRQVALYWSISIVAMLITSFATGFVAHHSPARGVERVAVVGLGFLGINLVLWVAKYVAYQKVVFRPAAPANSPTAGLAAETLALDSEPLRERLLEG